MLPIRNAHIPLKTPGYDQKTLVENLRRSAQKNPHQTAKNIKSSGVESQDDLIAIAKICAGQRKQTSVEHFDQFGIKDESARIEIAIIYLQNDFHAALRHFPQFHITNQAALVELVKNQIESSFFGVCNICEQIDKFGLSQNSIKEILEFALQKDPFYTLVRFKHSAIKDASLKHEYAMKCAEHVPEHTANRIAEFGIMSQDVRKKLLTTCYNGAAEATLANFQSFAISDQDFLIQFAQMSAEKNALITGNHVKKFSIQSDAVRFELFLECAHRADSRNFWYNFLPFPQKLTGIVSLMFELMLSGLKESQRKPDRDTLDSLLKETVGKIACSEEKKGSLLALGGAILDALQETHQEKFLWFLHFLTMMADSDQDTVQWIFDHELWKELAELNAPILRLHLTPWLFSLAGNKDKRALWSDFLASTPSRKGIRLLSLSFHALNEAGIPLEPIQRVCNDIVHSRKARDVINIPLLVEMPFMLATEPLLSPEQKLAAFLKIFSEMPKPSLVENPQHKGQGTRRKQVKGNPFKKPWEDKLFKDHFSVKLLLLQQETNWIDSQEDVNVFFHNAFEKLIPLKGLENDAASSYAHTFAISRHPQGLLTYAAGLKTLNQPALLDSLGNYVVSVFDGTFKTMRYETQNNPHLAKVFEARPDLRDVWPKKIVCSEIVDLRLSGNRTFQARDWIHSQLIEFGHLGKEDISYVRAFLNAPTEEERSSVTSDLSNKILKLTETLEEPSALLNCKLQQACIHIALAGSVDDLISLEPQLLEIQGYLPISTELTEFHHDVKGQLIEIAHRKNASKDRIELQAMITDDPFDLLYCGSDVHGSCQRLDGIPANNKGLLGYLNDGKILLLALKNRQGKIVARAVLKLLWDGERPVLYREKIYPNTASPSEIRVLNQLALKAAKQMAVTLTTRNEAGELYGKELKALGGPAPFEYSDGAGSIAVDGIYTIRDVIVLS